MVNRITDSPGCKPLTYLITSGKLNEDNFASESPQMLEILETAVNAKITLIQIREKNLDARSIAELTSRTVEIARNSETKILVNERFDLALAAGADGVHLTSKSIPVGRVRVLVPDGFLIGVSTHTLEASKVAREGGADFITFSPVYPTGSKAKYGKPAGIGRLREVCKTLAPFPVVALGGIDLGNYKDTIDAGAFGYAGISFFSDPANYKLIGRA